MYLDLHIHSHFSDGESSLENIVNEVIKNKCTLFAITDHNFLPNTKKIKETVVKNNIQCIDGIEISTLYHASSAKLALHILGYSRELNRNVLSRGLQQTIDGYNCRAIAIINKINKMLPGIMLDFQSIQNSGYEPYVSRNTLARLVVRHLNNTLSIKDVLRQYVFLDKENSNWMMSPKESFELIARANGIPVLAHSGKELQMLGYVAYEKMLVGFVNEGLLGLEVYSPKHSQEEIKILRNFAKKFGLYITGGNDWHGRIYTPEIKIGLNVPTEDIASFLVDKRVSIL